MQGETIRGSQLAAYLDAIGVRAPSPATCPFDPGVAPAVLASHLEQSAHLMLSLKVSMACWMIADESATRRKVASARTAGVPTHTGGGPYEVAVAQGRLAEYLDLCGDIGFDGIECGAGFTSPDVTPERVVQMASERALTVEYELGKKHDGAFDARRLQALIDEGQRWLQAGAKRLVIEARESAAGVGLFDTDGRLDVPLAERLVDALGMATLVFEAPPRAVSSLCSTTSALRSCSPTSHSMSCFASRSTGAACTPMRSPIRS